MVNFLPAILFSHDCCPQRPFYFQQILSHTDVTKSCNFTAYFIAAQSPSEYWHFTNSPALKAGEFRAANRAPSPLPVLPYCTFNDGCNFLTIYTENKRFHKYQILVYLLVNYFYGKKYFNFIG